MKVMPGIMPGVASDKIRFFTNSDGIRGDEIPRGNVHRILAIGGSTTECLFLDQSKSWPGLLQNKLNARGGGKVWVGNAGVSGHTSRQHVLYMKYFLPQHPEIKTVLMMVGCNDLQSRLSRGGISVPQPGNDLDLEGKLLPQAFFLISERQAKNAPFFKKTGFWMLGRHVKRVLFQSENIEENEGAAYVEWRKNRRSALSIRNKLPDLKVALEEYVENTDAIIDLAQKYSVRLVFMTQPAMWRRNMPRGLQDLLWFGWIGESQTKNTKVYYSIEVLEEGMKLYNDALMATHRRRNVECVDLAGLLPKDATVFYDDVHFNESGARKVAEILEAYLLDAKFVQNYFSRE